MIPLVKRLFHALLWDELAARRWIRGLLLWLGGAGIQVVSVGWDVAQGWSWREWSGRMLVAGILGLGGMVTAGERNARPSPLPAVELPPEQSSR